MAIEKKMLVDVMGDMLGIKYNGIDIEDSLMKDAMQSRMYNFVRDVGIANAIFQKFLSEKEKNSKLTAREFFQPIRDRYREQGKDASKLKNGLCDFDTICNVFDVMGRLHGKGDQHYYSTFEATKNSREIVANAEMAYFYIDQVSQMITADDKLREKYLKADKPGREAIITSCLDTLKANGQLKNTAYNQINIANFRWRPYFAVSADEAILQDLESGLDAENKSSLNSTLYDFMRGQLRKDLEKFETYNDHLSSVGESVVDIDTSVYTDSLGGAQSTTDDSASTHRNGDNSVRFGDLYPRGIPQHKIAKMLQPFNIKAGLKLLDAIIEAFSDVLVSNPWSRRDKTPTK